MLSDLKLAFRLLARDRGFTAAAVVTLALGLGATSTVFTIVNAILLRPLPIAEPDRVVDIGGISYPDLRALREGLRTLEDIAAVDERSMSVSDDRAPSDRYLGAFLSGNAFALIQQGAALGRTLVADDDRAGAPPVVLLGHDIWRTRYGSEPGIVGRSVRVNGQPATVVGVMPEGFGFPMNAQLWQPVSLLPESERERRSADFLSGFGRLRPGASLDQATADLAAAFARLERVDPQVVRPRRDVVVFRSGVGPGTPASEAFLFMLGAVIFVLLIACANVANLLLVRRAARAREVSVRLSLGASRLRIVREHLAETVLISIAAGGLALAMTTASLRMLWGVLIASGQNPPYWLSFALNGRVFAVLAAACFGTALLTGSAPAWIIARANPGELLGDAGRGGTAGRRTPRSSAVLVAGQLALAVVLLTGAATMVRGVLMQMQIEAGVDTSTLVTARLDLGAANYAPAQRAQFYRDVEERFAAIPGVTASFASAVPLDGAPELTLVTDSRPDLPAEDRPLVGRMTIGERYFEMLGVRIVRGRMFRYDDPDAAAVAVINERLARMHFGGVEPVGRRLRLLQDGEDAGSASDAPWLTIVGVVENVRQRLVEGGDFDPLVYVPATVNPASNTNVIVRSSLPLAATVSRLRTGMAAVDADLPLFGVRTVDEEISLANWAPRFVGSLFTIFASIALVLALVGMYAVAAYAAAHRVREIGVRMALGALPVHIWWVVSRSAAAQLAAGLVLGIAGGIAMARILPSELAGTAGGEGVTILFVASLLVTVAMGALLVPARRALRLNPAVVLRSE